MAARLYDSPEEELESLQNEDHVTDMKAITHLKATERANTKGSTVPVEVSCYHTVSRRSALAERLHDEAERVAEKLKQAMRLREQAAAVAEKLKGQMNKDHQMKADADRQYCTEHSAALNAYETAKSKTLVFFRIADHEVTQNAHPEAQGVPGPNARSWKAPKTWGSNSEAGRCKGCSLQVIARYWCSPVKSRWPVFVGLGTTK